MKGGVTKDVTNIHSSLTVLDTPTSCPVNAHTRD